MPDLKSNLWKMCHFSDTSDIVLKEHIRRLQEHFNCFQKFPKFYSECIIHAVEVPRDGDENLQDNSNFVPTQELLNSSYSEVIQEIYQRWATCLPKKLNEIAREIGPLIQFQPHPGANSNHSLWQADQLSNFQKLLYGIDKRNHKDKQPNSICHFAEETSCPSIYLFALMFDCIHVHREFPQSGYFVLNPIGREIVMALWNSFISVLPYTFFIDHEWLANQDKTNFQIPILGFAQILTIILLTHGK
jgi:hypothetical protein